MGHKIVNDGAILETSFTVLNFSWNRERCFAFVMTTSQEEMCPTMLPVVKKLWWKLVLTALEKEYSVMGIKDYEK